MEAGSLLRDVLLVCIHEFLGNGEVAKVIGKDRIPRCLDVLEQAKADKAIQRQVVEQGVRKVSGEC